MLSEGAREVLCISNHLVRCTLPKKITVPLLINRKSDTTQFKVNFRKFIITNLCVPHTVWVMGGFLADEVTGNRSPTRLQALKPSGRKMN